MLPIDPNTQDIFRRLFEKEFIISATTKESSNGQEHERAATRQAQEPEEYEFRLFSGPPPGVTTDAEVSTRINIRSLTPTTAEPGFIQPRRPDYYFRGQLDEQEAFKFQAVAVSGEDVLAEVQRRWVWYLYVSSNSRLTDEVARKRAAMARDYFESCSTW